MIITLMIAWVRSPKTTLRRRCPLVAQPIIIIYELIIITNAKCRQPEIEGSEGLRLEVETDRICLTTDCAAARRCYGMLGYDV